MATRCRAERDMATTRLDETEKAMAALCQELGLSGLSPADAVAQGYRPVEDWMPHIGSSSRGAALNRLKTLSEKGLVDRVAVVLPVTGKRSYYYRPKK